MKVKRERKAEGEDQIIVGILGQKHKTKSGYQLKSSLQRAKYPTVFQREIISDVSIILSNTPL